jgi:hypothetical protein
MPIQTNTMHLKNWSDFIFIIIAPLQAKETKIPLFPSKQRKEITPSTQKQHYLHISLFSTLKCLWALGNVGYVYSNCLEYPSPTNFHHHTEQRPSACSKYQLLFPSGHLFL